MAQKIYQDTVIVGEIDHKPVILLDKYQGASLKSQKFYNDEVVYLSIPLIGKTYSDVLSVCYKEYYETDGDGHYILDEKRRYTVKESHYYVPLNPNLFSVGDELEVTIRQADTPRYEEKNKKVIRIGQSLAISIDSYQRVASPSSKFKVGDLVYIRIAKEGKVFSGSTRVNTYGSTYVVYLDSRWGFSASDIVDVIVERMIK